MAVDTPHFDLPFVLGRAGANVVEQDTIDDIANCVLAIALTHVGWREEVPEFGLPDYALRNQPLGADDIKMTMSTQERRAVLLVTERPDKIDPLIDRINVGVSLYRRSA
jgi:hypothetical protein